MAIFGHIDFTNYSAIFGPISIEFIQELLRRSVRLVEHLKT